MPEPENDIYSFNCCFEEEDDSFRVDVPKQLTIEELRMEIHKKRPMSDPYRVKVYKCAIPLCHGFVKEMKTLLQGPEAGESRLLMSWKIREHFLEAPKTGLLHIIVQKSHIKLVPVIGKVVVSSGVTRMRTKEEEAKDTVVQLPKVKINRTGDLLRRWQEPVEANDENALIKHLNRPLEEEEKIPISRDEFDYLVTDCHCNDPKSELGAKDAAMLFRVSDEEMALGIYIRFADALDRTPTESGDEAACLTTWDLNISSIVKLILSQGKVIRDSNKGTNTELKRPDYGFLVNNHCLFRGEEEAPDSNGDPKTELVNKLVSYIYQPLNFIIGYYAIGPMVNYVSITSSMQTQPLFGHDLMSKRERLKNLVHLIRLCGVLFWMGSELPPRINPEYHTFIRDDGTKMTIGAVVKKLFKHNEAAQHVNDLGKIYQLLADKQVPNVDKLVKSGVEDGHAYISTQPIGMDWHPFNGTDLFNVATCVLQTLKIMHSGPNPVYHRDIRQPNILKRHNEDGWFLIDWSDATTPPTKPARKTFSREEHSPRVFAENHGGEVDVWGVGHYLKRYYGQCKVKNSARVKAMAERWMETPTITAREALEEITDCRDDFV